MATTKTVVHKPGKEEQRQRAAVERARQKVFGTSEPPADALAWWARRLKQLAGKQAENQTREITKIIRPFEKQRDDLHQWLREELALHKQLHLRDERRECRPASSPCTAWRKSAQVHAEEIRQLRKALKAANRQVACLVVGKQTDTLGGIVDAMQQKFGVTPEEAVLFAFSDELPLDVDRLLKLKRMFQERVAERHRAEEGEARASRMRITVPKPKGPSRKRAKRAEPRAT